MKISVFLVHKDVSCWNFEAPHLKKLHSAFPGCEIENCKNEKEFTRSLHDTEIALIWNFKQDWFDFSPCLKKIVTPAAGRDYFHVTPPEGVKIEYSSFHGRIIGETILAMILSHSRGILRAYNLQTKTPWPGKELSKSMRLLNSSTVTILGFGNIGVWAGRFLKPLGSRIIGIKRKPTTQPEYFTKTDRILDLKDLDSVLPETDHLVLCLPGGEETKMIINEKRLSLLRENSAIYNLGRGNSIDEKALSKALKTKK